MHASNGHVACRRVEALRSTGPFRLHPFLYTADTIPACSPPTSQSSTVPLFRCGLRTTMYSLPSAICAVHLGGGGTSSQAISACLRPFKLSVVVIIVGTAASQTATRPRVSIVAKIEPRGAGMILCTRLVESMSAQYESSEYPAKLYKFSCSSSQVCPLEECALAETPSNFNLGTELIATPLGSK